MYSFNEFQNHWISHQMLDLFQSYNRLFALKLHVFEKNPNIYIKTFSYKYYTNHKFGSKEDFVVS